MEKDYPCYRCDGRGKIQAYSHVMSGVCFKCGGSGRQKSKPARTVMWAVLGTNPQTGEEVHCYNVNAPTGKKAIDRARVTASGASESWKAEHSLEHAVAVPSAEYWTAERLEALE